MLLRYYENRCSQSRPAWLRGEVNGDPICPECRALSAVGPPTQAHFDYWLLIGRISAAGAVPGTDPVTALLAKERRGELHH